ncbi:MAG: DUF4493 domain-containing protein [Mucinivorans sp.]
MVKRLLNILLVLLVVSVMTSCRDVLVEQNGQGVLVVDVIGVDFDHQVDPLSKSAPTTPSSYSLSITSLDGKVLYQGAFQSGAIPLPLGQCKVKVFYGDNLPGFDNPYYEGLSDATVVAGGATLCRVTVKLGSAIISPKYSADLVAFFSSYSTRVVSGTTTQNITSTESRQLYVPSGVQCAITIIGTNTLGVKVERPVNTFVPEAGKLYNGNLNLAPVVFSVAEQDAALAWSHSFAITPVTAANFVDESHYNGYKDKVIYQYSADGVTWIDVPSSGQVTGLNSGTTYRLRGRVGSNISSNVVTLTTELPQQVQNAAMDQWQLTYFTAGSSASGYSKGIPLYYPWNAGGEEWWSTSNCRSVRYTVFKNQWNNLPGVMWTTSGQNGRAAEIRSVHVDAGAGQWSVCGKLLIGSMTSDAPSGGYGAAENITEGRPFTTRPTKMRFWYKYSQYGTDSYRITVRLRNGNTVIAEKEVTANGTNSSYQQMEMALPYSVTNLKATSIYICFASSLDDNFTYNGKGVAVSYPDCWGSGWKGEVGSILNIDEIELIYEK